MMDFFVPFWLYFYVIPWKHLCPLIPHTCDEVLDAAGASV